MPATGFNNNIDLSTRQGWSEKWEYYSAGIGKNFVSHDRIVTFHGGCLMGEDVMFLGDAHSFDDPSHPIGSGSKPMDVPLLICEDTWIGSRSIILSGCKRVGAHSIIGAGSVVTHDVPDYAIVGGNPARVIRMRK